MDARQHEQLTLGQRDLALVLLLLAARRRRRAGARPARRVGRRRRRGVPVLRGARRRRGERRWRGARRLRGQLLLLRLLRRDDGGELLSEVERGVGGDAVPVAQPVLEHACRAKRRTVEGVATVASASEERSLRREQNGGGARTLWFGALPSGGGSGHWTESTGAKRGTKGRHAPRSSVASSDWVQCTSLPHLGMAMLM